MEKRLTPHTVLVVGATGLVGSKLLDLLVAEIAVTRVIVLGRSAPVLDSNKIDFHIFDFQDYSSVEGLFQGVHSVYCCIGTTIKKAGSQENFRKIDFDIPDNLARLCEKSGVTSFLVISSLGAYAGSTNFYLKTKGEMEKAVASYKIPKIAFFRPSLLLGPRSETRYFESVMKAFLAVCSPFMVGVLKKFKPISSVVVARAMIHVSYSSSNVKVYETDEIRWMGR